MTTRSSSEGIPEPNEQPVAAARPPRPWTKAGHLPPEQCIQGWRAKVGVHEALPWWPCRAWNCPEHVGGKRRRGWWRKCIGEGPAWLSQIELDGSTWAEREAKGVVEAEYLASLHDRVQTLTERIRRRLHRAGASWVGILYYHDDGVVTLGYLADRDMTPKRVRYPGEFEVWEEVSAEAALAWIDVWTALGRPVGTSLNTEADGEPAVQAARFLSGGRWRARDEWEAYKAWLRKNGWLTICDAEERLGEEGPSWSTEVGERIARISDPWSFAELVDQRLREWGYEGAELLSTNIEFEGQRREFNRRIVPKEEVPWQALWAAMAAVVEDENDDADL